MARSDLAFFIALLAVGAASSGTPARESAQLLQTWTRTLAGEGEQAGAKNNPISRVVNLLKDMKATLTKEMEEDEELYNKLACWCTNNDYEKTEAIEKAEAKIAELESNIESWTAKSAELKVNIKDLEAQVAADKSSLAEATAMREKQQKEFHGMELDAIQQIESLKAALTVLAKHFAGAGGSATTKDSSVAGGAVYKTEQDSWSFLQGKGKGKKDPVDDRLTMSLDSFMDRNGFDSTPAVDSKSPADKFLQQTNVGSASSSSSSALSAQDEAIVQRAMKAAAAFAQTHHTAAYFPAYSAQSGEIVGLLKTIKEEMEGDLSEAQKTEAARASEFADLRAAKTSQIQDGEKTAERKEDELATTDNDLAEAKEDLAQVKATLSEDQKFLMNLKKTCSEGEANFAARKNARMEEIQAVSATIEILMSDDARDAMSGTYSFLQVVSQEQRGARRGAAHVLRAAASKVGSPDLAALATSVELDAFTRVKKLIDDMIAKLKIQNSDEVKKNDWCKDEIQENEMTTAKTETLKEDLAAKIASLDSSIKTLEEGIAECKSQIAQTQVSLQRATEDRQKENMEFQKTVADQIVVVEVLKTALNKLATYYDKDSLLQRKTGAAASQRQTPPVPQMEYKPSKGATGVMQMIEKLIYEAKAMKADATKAENEAQLAYEQTVRDTNGSVSALSKEIRTKTKAKAEAKKDKSLAEDNLDEANTELEGLAKYNGELHVECDYILKNFDARQEARSQEIEALQQAKQILSGASLS